MGEQNQQTLSPQQPPIPPQNINSPSAPQQRSWIKWVLIIVLIALLSSGATYLVLNSQSQKPPPPQIVQTIPSPTPDLYTEGTRSATANWKTYANLEGRFSLRYPDEWNVQTGGSITTGTLTSSFGTNIESVTEDPSTAFWVQVHSEKSNSPVKNAEQYKDSLVKTYKSTITVDPIIVDGVSGFRTAYTDATIKIHNIVVDKNGLIYSIAFRQTGEDETLPLETFDQILSTFKFTN